MIFELVNVGSDRYTGTFRCDSDGELLREIARRLGTAAFEIAWDDLNIHGKIYVGGWSKVGEVWRNRRAEAQE